MSDDIRPYEVDASEILKPTTSDRIAALEAIVETLNLRLLSAEVSIKSLLMKVERLRNGAPR